ncbi:MAG TPA: biotin transporter BioY [Spirochaetota bacterium]|nr:biotin transporter BioY [Spirochaetota bacterium]
MNEDNIRKMTLSAVFTVLIIAGSYLVVPIGVVPIVLQNMFVLMAGVMLGPLWGAVSVCAFLVLGALGLPVFSGGRGGAAHILGPTGGYLVAYIPAVIICGVINLKKSKKIILILFSMVSASLVIYLIGVTWLKLTTSISWDKAVFVGMLPFLLGDALKIAVAAFMTFKLSPLLKNLGIGN